MRRPSWPEYNVCSTMLKMKYLKLAKPIRVDDKEFGEKYHIAVALLRDQQLTAAVLGPDTHRAEPFLSLWAKGRVRHLENGYDENDYEGPTKSTDIYCSNWSRDAALEWRQIICAKSKPYFEPLKKFLDQRLELNGSPSVLVWLRNKEGKEESEERNSTPECVTQIVDLVKSKGLRPILIGDVMAEFKPEKGNLVRFYDHEVFQCDDKICLQLRMFDILMRDFGVYCSVGMKSGGMDGPGLFLGLKTLSIAFGGSRAKRVKLIEKTIENFELLIIDPRRKATLRELLKAEPDQLCQFLEESQKSKAFSA